jgi:hypothetical protein
MALGVRELGHFLREVERARKIDTEPSTSGRRQPEGVEVLGGLASQPTFEVDGRTQILAGEQAVRFKPCSHVVEPAERPREQLDGREIVDRWTAVRAAQRKRVGDLRGTRFDPLGGDDSMAAVRHGFAIAGA